jgi:trehalose-6-phosphate synthase
VLILSEFTGAAQSLGAGSIRINPWNLDETANAIHRALTMSKAERFSRHQLVTTLFEK